MCVVSRRRDKKMPKSLTGDENGSDHLALGDHARPGLSGRKIICQIDELPTNPHHEKPYKSRPRHVQF